MESGALYEVVNFDVGLCGHIYRVAIIVFRPRGLQEPYGRSI